jgi:hypothetical protein
MIFFNWLSMGSQIGALCMPNIAPLARQSYDAEKEKILKGI